MTLLVFYIGLCALLGWWGSRLSFGFWGYFFISLFFTPLLGFLFVIGSGERKPSAPISKIVAEIEELRSYVAKFQSAGLTAKETKDLVDRIATLERLVRYERI